MTLFLWCSSKENNDSVHDNELFHKIKELEQEVANLNESVADGSPQERASRRSLHQYRSPQRAAGSLQLAAYSLELKEWIDVNC